MTNSVRAVGFLAIFGSLQCWPGLASREHAMDNTTGGNGWVNSSDIGLPPASGNGQRRAAAPAGLRPHRTEQCHLDV